MAGANEETGKGKGKGRVRATSGSSSNVATEPRSQPPGEMTPPTTKQIPHQRTPSGAGAMGRTVVEEAFRRLSEPVKAPRVKPTCVFAAIVAVLAVCRGILLPVSCKTAEYPLPCYTLPSAVLYNYSTVHPPVRTSVVTWYLRTLVGAEIPWTLVGYVDVSLEL